MSFGRIGAATDSFASFTNAYYSARDIAGVPQVLVECLCDRQMDRHMDECCWIWLELKLVAVDITRVLDLVY